MKLSIPLFIIFLIAGTSISVLSTEPYMFTIDRETLREGDFLLEGTMPGGIATDTQYLQLGVLAGQMKYDNSHLEVNHGSMVAIVFNNNGIMIHNLLILRPGSTAKVGMAADKMITQKDANEKSYVPDMDEVLFHTPLVDPGKEFKLVFKAPEQKGEYPFICTFPGHWRIMQGVLKVK